MIDGLSISSHFVTDVRQFEPDDTDVFVHPCFNTDIAVSAVKGLTVQFGLCQKRHVTVKPTVKRIQECHNGIILIEFSKINQMNAKNEKIVENEIFGLMMR